MRICCRLGSTPDNSKAAHASCTCTCPGCEDVLALLNGGGAQGCGSECVRLDTAQSWVDLLEACFACVQESAANRPPFTALQPVCHTHFFEASTKLSAHCSSGWKPICATLLPNEARVGASMLPILGSNCMCVHTSEQAGINA